MGKNGSKTSKKYDLKIRPNNYVVTSKRFFQGFDTSFSSLLASAGLERDRTGGHLKERLLATALLTFLGFALNGQIGIHDPSTVVQCDGKYYTYGTGGSSLVSDDGWTWSRGANLPRRGLAPDVIHIGDRYYVYVAANIGAQPKAAINMIWSKSLDPKSPDYKWEEGGVVASSDGIEESNAIDPGVFRDPITGRLWLVYGSYFGFIREVELDPKTGTRINPKDKPRDLAINCEASDLMYHAGWYYLLATHGSCCRGADSGYNIRLGRSRNVTGPFLDAEGIDMIQGGGKLLIGSESRRIGPGHFGLLDLGNGVEKFSMHWEADLDRGGASVLDIRPLLWKDGWPIAGENMKDGVFEVESQRTGTALELAVEGMPVGGRPVRGPRPSGGPRPAGAPQAAIQGGPPAGFGGMFAGIGVPIPPQDVAEVAKNWPAGPIDLRLAGYLSQAQQKWSITAVPDAGGYLGSPYFKITVAGTDRALAASPDMELVVVPSFTGAPEQLWEFDQLADSTWRIMPKSSANSKTPVALSAIGSSSPTLEQFDPSSEKQHWVLKMQ
jgi:arabinan endo-1,5-alpha-L-arabinosidase